MELKKSWMLGAYEMGIIGPTGGNSRLCKRSEGTGKKASGSTVALNMAVAEKSSVKEKARHFPVEGRPHC